jgi:HEAT repeat protein
MLIAAITFFTHEPKDAPLSKPEGDLSAQHSHTTEAQPKPIEPVVSKTDKAEATAEATVEAPDIGARFQAVMALRERKDPEAVRLLQKFLNDPDNAVVSEAIDTLGYIGLNSDLKGIVFEILADRAQDKSFNLRGDALITAAMLGEKEQVVSLIAEFVAENYEGSDAAAVRAMAFALSPELVPHITTLVERNDNPGVQRECFSLLARINNSKAIDLLEKYLRSDTPGEQAGSVWALSRQNDAYHNQILVAAIAGKTLQHEAVGEVARSPAAGAVFSELFENSNVDDRQRINWLKIMSNNVSSAPGDVRNAMADVALSLVNSPNPDVQRQALETLSKAAASKDLTEAIEPHLESGNFLIQKAALEAFIQYLTPKTYEPLKKLWFHEDEKTRRTAFFFSEPFLSQVDIPDLRKASQHSDQFIAKHSTMMLKYLDPLQ